MADSKSEFLRLRDVDSSFQNRSNSVFERLGRLEQSNENSAVRTELETSGNRQRHASRGRNSPRSGSRRLPARVPQHVLSPEKWTKYSLENDGSENFRGMNEHSLNKHAAHSFLADLKKRKSVENGSRPNTSTIIDRENWKVENDVEGQSECVENRDSVAHEDSVVNEQKTNNVRSFKTHISEQSLEEYSQKAVSNNDDSKFLFKKPNPKMDMTSSSSSSTTQTWRNGAFVMPEYAVGSSTSRPKTSPRASIGKSSGQKPVEGNHLVNLRHLEDKVDDFALSRITEEKTGKKKGKRNFRKRKLEEGKDECEENTN